MRLTDVDNLIDCIYDAMNTDMDAYMNHDMVEKIIKKIDTAPIVEAEPIIHAHWVIRSNQKGFSSAILYYCSSCGRILRMPWGNKPNEYAPYCHCGAKMDEEADK